MLEDSLYKIGITKNEARVYLDLLSIGPQAVSVVAKHCGFKRTSAYSILNSLVVKGLVALTKKNGMSYFSANDPSCIVSFLDRKSRSFDFYKDQIIKIIPKMRNLNKEAFFEKPFVEYREGYDSVRHTLYYELEKTDFVYMFLALKSSIPDALKPFISEAIDREIKLKVIAPDSKDSRGFFLKHYTDVFSSSDVLFLKKFEFKNIFRSFVNIYDNKMIMFNFEPKKEYAVIVHSYELFVIQRNIFELMWTLNVVDNI